jgi:hypothetical protein
MSDGLTVGGHHEDQAHAEASLRHSLVDHDRQADLAYRSFRIAQTPLRTTCPAV